MAEALQYYELWTKLPADGGTRVGFLGWPLNPRRVRRLNGDDSLSFQYPKTGLYAASVVKGSCVREILSADGTTNVLEWLVDRYTPATGQTPVVSVSCLAPMTRLLNYPINQTDADGVVYRNVSAIQLPAATVMASYILSNTPAWVTAGTLSPSGNQEIPFSDDNALSGTRRWEDLTHLEAEFLRVGLTGYTLGIVSRGASATKLYLQAGKNIQSWQPEYGNGTHRNRIDTVIGAPGDFGSAGLGLAYWEVVSLTGAGPYTLVLKAIHGGAGPVQFDNQFNHSGLPGGANSLYWEKRDRTYTQITGSNAAAQSLTIASNTTITAGDYGRIVASATGKHLTFLDAPVEMAATGLVSGKFESGWDDAMAITPNAEMVTWTTPTAAPDGWTAAATITKLTSANNWLTAGQSLQVAANLAAGSQICATPAKAWVIQARQSTWYCTAWIRLVSNSAAATGVGIGLGLYAAGVLVGQLIRYIGPLNVWRQLKIEGLDLSAFVGLSKSMQAQITVEGPSATTFTLIVDSINYGPGTAVRPMTWGSNAARIWQDANLDLNDTKAVPVSRRGSILDLASMNNVSAEDVVLGGTVQVRADDLTEPTDVVARIVELAEVPGSPERTEVVVSTLPMTLSRKQSAPLALTIPFFEALEVRAVDRDNRQAAILLKAAITATALGTVTITLTASDSLGAGVFISYAASSGVTYVSGSGLGPYVFNRPAPGVGTGRVVFTGQVAGRADVYDAVDVPARDPLGFTVKETYSETDTTGTLVIVIADDPSTRVTGVKFATQSGNAALSAYGAEDTSVPYTSPSVAFVEKQPSKIAYQVMGTDSAGTAAQVLWEGVVTLKPSVKPGLPNIWGNISSNSITAGQVDIRIEGDADTASIRYAVSTSSMPADATVDAATASNVNARVSAGTNVGTLAPNGTIFVKARAWSAINAGGTGSDYAQLTLRRDDVTKDKWIVVPGADFVPAGNASTWASGAVFEPNNTTQQIAYAGIVLPPGATIKEVHLHGYRKVSSTTLQVELMKLYGSAILDSVSVIATVSIASGDNTNYQDASVTGLSEAVATDGTGKSFLKATLNSGAAGLVGVGQVKIKYNSPDIGTTI